MQNLVASLLTQLSPKTREQDVSRDQLNSLIDRLQQQQDELAQRLSRATRSANKRRLKLKHDAAQMQLKKARALRLNLTR